MLQEPEFGRLLIRQPRPDALWCMVTGALTLTVWEFDVSEDPKGTGPTVPYHASIYTMYQNKAEYLRAFRKEDWYCLPREFHDALMTTAFRRSVFALFDTAAVGSNVHAAWANDVMNACKSHGNRYANFHDAYHAQNEC